MVAENLRIVKQKIQMACQRSGRNQDEVTLIAVSKTKPVEMIEAAMDTGQKDFGENKVQELVSKYETIKNELNWHLIGHLQRNKVKYIIDKVCLIHSVDSIRLATQISEEAKKHQLLINILIQVNIAGEDTKFGVSPEETLSLIKEVAKLPSVRIKGLMAIPPFVDNPEDNRIHFRNLKKLYVDIKSKNIDNVDMDVLSMGMTDDFEVAIEEGSTMVRVGTGIFGSRYYE